MTNRGHGLTQRTQLGAQPLRLGPLCSQRRLGLQLPGLRCVDHLQSLPLSLTLILAHQLPVGFFACIEPGLLGHRRRLALEQLGLELGRRRLSLDQLG